MSRLVCGLRVLTLGPQGEMIDQGRRGVLHGVLSGNGRMSSVLEQVAIRKLRGMMFWVQRLAIMRLCPTLDCA